MDTSEMVLVVKRIWTEKLIKEKRRRRKESTVKIYSVWSGHERQAQAW